VRRWLSVEAFTVCDAFSKSDAVGTIDDEVVEELNHARLRGTKRTGV